LGLLPCFPLRLSRCDIAVKQSRIKGHHLVGRVNVDALDIRIPSILSFKSAYKLNFNFAEIAEAPTYPIKVCIRQIHALKYTETLSKQVIERTHPIHR